MSDWKSFKWGDIASIEYGKSLKDYQNNNGRIPVFGTNGPIGTTDTMPLCNHNGVIIGRKGAYRGIHYSAVPFFVIDTAFYLKPKVSELDLKFAYYQLLSVDINSMDSGSAIPSTSREDFYNLDIELPPLIEQKAIAEVLSSLDDKIDLLQRNNHTLEQMAETLFRHWFMEEVNTTWPEDILDNHFSILRGLSYKGAGLSTSSDLLAVPMVNLNSVYEGGGFKGSGTKFYNKDYKDRHLVYPGDLIITNTEQGHEHRLIGFSAFVPKNIGEKAIFSQHIYRLEPKGDKVTPELLHYMFKFSIRDQIIAGTNGSTVNMLPIVAVEKCRIFIPEKKLVSKFTTIVKEINAKIELNNLQAKNLENIRDSLLPKLMNGALIVKSNMNGSKCK